MINNKLFWISIIILSYVPLLVFISLYYNNIFDIRHITDCIIFRNVNATGLYNYDC